MVEEDVIMIIVHAAASRTKWDLEVEAMYGWEKRHGTFIMIMEIPIPDLHFCHIPVYVFAYLMSIKINMCDAKDG
jgi:hypothetical protein